VSILSGAVGIYFADHFEMVGGGREALLALPDGIGLDEGLDDRMVPRETY
jgi:hypothetical protein